MRFIILFFAVFISLNVSADSLIKIDLGQDYHKYSQGELQKRVWELERAVSQLQQRVIDLERNEIKNDRRERAERVEYDRYQDRNPPRAKDSWICTVKAMGRIHTGTGVTRAVATERVMNSCKDANHGDSFFCSNISCSQ